LNRFQFELIIFF